MIEAKYLAKIIKACRESQVKHLKLGDLEISFATGEAEETKVRTGDTVNPPTENELKEIERAVTDNAVLDRADEELAHMQVENPGLFEELLVQRELEGSGEFGEKITLDI